jgi:predicted ATPase
MNRLFPRLSMSYRNLRLYTTPTTLYKQKLGRGEVHHDERQIAVLKVMDTFHDNLKHHRPTKSLYIYGGVGTGKTMMMDILYETCTFVPNRKRTHFNKFMLQFHSRIHQLRRNEPNKDHMPTVIDQIFHESSFLCFDEFQVNLSTR